MTQSLSTKPLVTSLSSVFCPVGQNWAKATVPLATSSASERQQHQQENEELARISALSSPRPSAGPMSLSCICDEGAVCKKMGDGSMQQEVVRGALGSHSDVFLEVRLLPHS